MVKQLSCARVRRYAEYNGLQSSAKSDNVCFPRTMGLGLSVRFGNCSLHLMHTLMHTRVVSVSRIGY